MLALAAVVLASMLALVHADAGVLMPWVGVMCHVASRM